MTTQKTTEYEELKTIFVSKLDKRTTESELFKKISEASNNQISNVMIRKEDHFETAIAYINMSTHAAAKEVISKFNGTQINGHVIQMSWALTNPSKINQNEANLYVKNIKKDVTALALQDAFAAFGEIFSCKLSVNEKGESNGFGYVRFVDVAASEAALAASEKLAETIGAEGFVIQKYDKPQKSARTNLYVGNIDKDITVDQFIKYFETFGPIKKYNDKHLVAFFNVPATGKNKGYVNFESPQDAEKALTAPKENVLGEGELTVAYYKTKTERKSEFKRKDQEIKHMINSEYKDFNLYVKTNKDVITIDEVKEALEGCGDIYSVKIRYTREKKPDGVFYICMKSREDKERVVAKCKELQWDAHDFKPRNDYRSKFGGYNMQFGLPNYMGSPMNYAQQPFFMNILNMLGMMNHQGGMPGFSGFPNGQMGVNNRPKGVSNKSGSQKKPRQTRNAQQQKPKPEEKPEEQVASKVPVVEEVTEEMRNDLGDSLFDYILEKHHFSEELTGRITGVLLESINFADLKDKMDNKKKELDGIILEIKQNLEEMDDQQ